MSSSLSSNQQGCAAGLIWLHVGGVYSLSMNQSHEGSCASVAGTMALLPWSLLELISLATVGGSTCQYRHAASYSLDYGGRIRCGGIDYILAGQKAE